MEHLQVQSCHIRRVINGYLITAATDDLPVTAVASSATAVGQIIKKIFTEGVPQDPDFAEVVEEGDTIFPGGICKEETTS